MGVITYANANALIDDVAIRGHKAAYGSTVYGFGELGSGIGVADALADAEAALSATGGDPYVDLGPSLQEFGRACSAKAIFGARARQFLAKLDRHIRDRGAGLYVNLDTFLTYYNAGAGGNWLAMQHPDLRTVWNQAKGGANYPKPYHLYFEVLTGGVYDGETFTNALAKWVVTGAGTGTLTDGKAVDYAKYAGGDPKAVVSGFGGAAATLTVTGRAFDPATKATVNGVTWTVSITGNGTFVLAVGTAPANSKIVDVSGISIGAAMTAGTVYVEAHRPAGRPAM